MQGQLLGRKINSFDGRYRHTVHILFSFLFNISIDLVNQWESKLFFTIIIFAKENVEYRLLWGARSSRTSQFQWTNGDQIYSLYQHLILNTFIDGVWFLINKLINHK